MGAYPGASGIPADPGIFISGGEISGNDASDGGGMSFIMIRRPVEIHNAVISGNTAVQGGGIEIPAEWTQADIDGCTITGNAADKNGGGILLVDAPDGTTLRDTTIKENTSGEIGAGVFYDESSKLTISGANTIQNNTYNGALNNLNIFSADHPVYVDGSLEGSQIGLSDPVLWLDEKTDTDPTAESAAKLTSGYEENNTGISPYQYFTSDHMTWKAAWSEDSTEARLVRDPIAENVTVGFERTSQDHVYDIYFLAYGKGSDDEDKENKQIHELASSDLLFEMTNIAGNTDGNVIYHIEPEEYITMLSDGNRYMFSLDGFHEYEKTDGRIKVGTITFEGFGEYKFTLDTGYNEDELRNVINATETANNIMHTYSVNAGTLDRYSKEEVSRASDVGTIEGIIHDTIAPLTQDLTINVVFPNIAYEQKTDYNAMSITLRGGNLLESYKIPLGGDPLEAGDKLTGELFAEKGSLAASYNGTYSVEYVDSFELNGTEYCAYKVEIKDFLAKMVTYAVNLEGEGYRTARAEVRMIGDRELTFWNNVMDENHMMVIDSSNEGDDTKLVSKNFLAGDIVADDEINLYDLSAVVSYFGTVDLSAENHPEYVRYDLNRDGMIDSKDIAYVLVSWKE